MTNPCWWRGRIIDLDRIEESNVTLDEIEAQMRKIRRFGGDGVDLWTHSQVVAALVVADGGTVMERELALWHDAHEVWTGDIIEPIKRQCPGLQAALLAWELRVTEWVMGRANMPGWAPSERVRKADRVAVRLELEEVQSWGPGASPGDIGRGLWERARKVARELKLGGEL